MGCFPASVFGVHTVYTIRNKADNKCYVGLTGRSLSCRFSQHVRDSRLSHRRRQMPILQAIHERPDNFSIHPEVICSSREEANNREKLYIIALRATNPMLGYNVHPGGSGLVPTSRSCEKMRHSALARVARAKPGERFYRTTRCPKGHFYRGKNLIIAKRGDGREIKRCRRCVRVREELRGANRKRQRHLTAPGTGSWQKAKTHCPKGHEYTLQNTWLQGGRFRRCKTCRAKENKDWKARKRTASNIINKGVN